MDIKFDIDFFIEHINTSNQNAIKYINESKNKYLNQIQIYYRISVALLNNIINIINEYISNLDIRINNINNIGDTPIKNEDEFNDKYNKINEKYNEVINVANVIKNYIEKQNINNLIEDLTGYHTLLTQYSAEVKNLEKDDIKNIVNFSVTITEDAIKKAYYINYKLKSSFILYNIEAAENSVKDYNNNNNKKLYEYVNFADFL